MEGFYFYSTAYSFLAKEIDSCIIERLSTQKLFFKKFWYFCVPHIHFTVVFAIIGVRRVDELDR